MELKRLDQQSFQPNVCLGQNKYLRVAGFSSGKTRYGRSSLLFYFIKIVNIDIAMFTTPPAPLPYPTSEREPFFFLNATSPLCTIKSTCLITIDNLENIISRVHDLVDSGMLNAIYFEFLICSSNSFVTCFLNIILLKDSSHINITYIILYSLIH